MENMVDLQSVQKTIDDFTLGPFDLTIEPGTVTALVGDNGSGKSTLLKIMMDLANRDQGIIKMFGHDPNGENEEWKQHVAYQPQTVIGYDAFTGNDLQTLISKWYPTWDQKQFIQIINALNIPLDKKFGKLSQGVQQKLTLALTIPRNAKLMILDEPTTFMDIPSKKIIIDLLAEWMEEDERAIILASHQAEDIKKLADYIVLLRGGKMLGHFEKESLTENYRKYWLRHPLENFKIPGVVYHEGNELISNRPQVTEKYLSEKDITPINSTQIELEELITLLLTNGIKQ